MSNLNAPYFGNVFSGHSRSAEKTPSTKVPTSSELLASCIRIVSEGDLLLEVSNGATSKHFLVASQVLVSISAVFAKMLGKKSNFAEAVALRESRDDDQPVIVKVEDDDPSTMKIILYALHSQYRQVPDSITLRQLFQAAVICDKYALHEALGLIAKVWSEPLKDGSEKNPQQWLFISWVFGPESVFTEVSRQLTLDGTSLSIPDKEDELVFGEEKLTLHECVPAAIPSKMVERREKCVKSLRAYIDGLECSYLRDNWQTNSICQQGDKNVQQCDAMQLGVLYRSLLVSGACTYTNDLTTFTDILKKIPVLKLGLASNNKSNVYCAKCNNWTNYGECSRCSTAHDSCSWVPKLHKMVDDSLAEIKGLTFSEFPMRTWGK